jgi:hypothetical protein
MSCQVGGLRPGNVVRKTDQRMGKEERKRTSGWEECRVDLPMKRPHVSQLRLQRRAGHQVFDGG